MTDTPEQRTPSRPQTHPGAGSPSTLTRFFQASGNAIASLGRCSPTGPTRAHRSEEMVALPAMSPINMVEMSESFRFDNLRARHAAMSAQVTPSNSPLQSPLRRDSSTNTDENEQVPTSVLYVSVAKMQLSPREDRPSEGPDDGTGVNEALSMGVQSDLKKIGRGFTQVTASAEATQLEDGPALPAEQDVRSRGTTGHYADAPIGHRMDLMSSRSPSPTRRAFVQEARGGGMISGFTADRLGYTPYLHKGAPGRPIGAAVPVEGSPRLARKLTYREPPEVPRVTPTPLPSFQQRPRKQMGIAPARSDKSCSDAVSEKQTQDEYTLGPEQVQHDRAESQQMTDANWHVVTLFQELETRLTVLEANQSKQQDECETLVVKMDQARVNQRATVEHTNQLHRKLEATLHQNEQLTEQLRQTVEFNKALSHHLEEARAETKQKVLQCQAMIREEQERGREVGKTQAYERQKLLDNHDRLQAQADDLQCGLTQIEKISRRDRQHLERRIQELEKFPAALDGIHAQMERNLQLAPLVKEVHEKLGQFHDLPATVEALLRELMPSQVPRYTSTPREALNLTDRHDGGSDVGRNRRRATREASIADESPELISSFRTPVASDVCETSQSLQPAEPTTKPFEAEVRDCKPPARGSEQATVHWERTAMTEPPKRNKVHTKLPTYGGKPQESLRTFLNKVDNAAHMGAWDNEFRACQLYAQLEGAALLYVDSLPLEERTDYHRLREALEKKYEGDLARDSCREQLKHVRRGRNETLETLSQRIRELARKAFPHDAARRDEEELHTFKAAVSDELSRTLVVGEYSTMDKCVEVLSRLESHIENRNKARQGRVCKVQVESNETHTGRPQAPVEPTQGQPAMVRAISGQMKEEHEHLGRCISEAVAPAVRGELRGELQPLLPLMQGIQPLMRDFTAWMRTQNESKLAVPSAQARGPITGRPRAGQGRRLPQRGGGPSRERPCSVCGSSEHWKANCPDAPEHTPVGSQGQKTHRNRDQGKENGGGAGPGSGGQAPVENPSRQ